MNTGKKLEICHRTGRFSHWLQEKQDLNAEYDTKNEDLLQRTG